MKKSLVLLSTILSSTLLASCGKDPCAMHIDANHDGICDVCESEVNVTHVDTDKNGVCDICEQNMPVDIDFAQFGWDEELARLFYFKLGTVIPYVPSNGYHYEYGVDIFGDNYINVYLFYSTEEIAGNAYSQFFNTCSEANYMMSSDRVYIDTFTYIDGIGYADKVLEGSKAIDIAFIDSIYEDSAGKRTPALGLFCTNYLYIPEDTFPREAIDIALGEEFAKDIPDLTGKDDEYHFFFGYTEAEDENGETYVDSKYLEIHIFGYDIFDFEEDLFNALIASKNNAIMSFIDGEEDGEVCREYPGFYFGQEFWCYNTTTIHGVKNFLEYAVQFGISSPMQGDSYLYIIIYYDIVD